MISNFNSSLGLRPTEDGTGVVLDPRPEHQVAPDTLHFAVLTTVAEVAAAHAVGVAVVPANVQVQLMSRARLAPVEGRGKVLRKGRRLAFCEGEVYQGDRLVAKATVTFAVL